jgi:Fanconi anemia group M protein
MAAAADPDPEYVEHPLLAEGVVERRPYQTDLAATATEGHTLVGLPTGLGKTTVSLLVTADRLADDAGARSLVLAPTKPLVEQHAAFYREALAIPDDEIVVFTGEVRPDDRADLWTGARVVVATPQVVENDLVGSRIDLRDVVHCTFDECHRATGDYAYTYIAERYHADAADPLVTAMSASPGDDREAVLTVCENLGVETVAVKTDDDPDVEPYAGHTEVDWKRVDLPETVREMRDLLNEVIEDRLERLRDLGVTNKTDPSMSEKDINRMHGKLRSLVDEGKSEGYEGMSLHAEVRKLRQAVTYVETQSVESARRYFERLQNAANSSGASKADQRLVSDPNVTQAIRLAEEYDDLHPKFRRARMLVAETLGIDDGERVIVFTESRDTAEALTDFLGDHFATRRFVGQGDREGSPGMTQTEQQETLDAFRAGEFEVLVSTSVAEEGLDVPDVDLVLFYEPVPTAIRSIQRKGRTGRGTEGRVVVLLAEDTRDEAYFWIARRREEEMADELTALQDMAGDLRDELGSEQVALGAAGDDGAGEGANEGDGGDDEAGAALGQAGLADFDASDGSEHDGDGADDDAGTVARAGTEGGDADSEDEVEVVADQREMDAPIARDLSTRDGVAVRLETLAVGDYVVSDRVAVERKEVADFVDSVVGDERSVFEQVGDLATHYQRPVVVVEGADLYGQRNVHPNAVRGALASLAADFGASVLRTEDADGTTDLLEALARREQAGSGREVSVHGEKATKTLPEQQEYVVSSIADVGPVTAQSLLAHFGSVEAVLTADEEGLQEVEGVGEVTAERIREVVGTPYRP